VGNGRIGREPGFCGGSLAQSLFFAATKPKQHQRPHASGHAAHHKHKREFIAGKKIG
jgi:hypothetical protein